MHRETSSEVKEPQPVAMAVIDSSVRNLQSCGGGEGGGVGGESGGGWWWVVVGGGVSQWVAVGGGEGGRWVVITEVRVGEGKGEGEGG